ncbi:MAG: binding 1 protein, partial [Patescibacteria group bacterium]|nr:binding 1 protein [Patescibacteria group bacterium]
GKLVAAFKAAEKLADPYFKQQIRLASDAVERGFVQVDKELEFEEMQASRRLKDLQDDIATRSEYLSLEEQNALKGIEREYKTTLDTTRQNLAASGFGSSSKRADTEQLIDESTGDLRESTKRSFGQQKLDANNQLVRGQRDIQSEVQRLKEVAKQSKTGLFRKAEEELGTSGLPKLNFDVNPLGGMVGSINEDKQNDILGAVRNLVF